MANKVLFIGAVFPESSSSAAGTRIIQLIESFVESEFEVHFASSSQESIWSNNISLLNVQKHQIILNDSSFDLFIQKLNPSIVVFDRFMTEEQFGWRVIENCPKALRILDTEDLHFLRDARKSQKKYTSNSSFNYGKSNIAKREIASILRSDITLIISKYELSLLKKSFKITSENLFYLPIICSNKIDTSKTFEERKNFVFIGNFIHEPNWDCVQHLYNDIWPQIARKLPEAEMHIYGSYPSQKVFQLNQEKKRFFIKGRAENALETIGNYKILLAPIRFGAGIKGKFLDAMQTHTPYITTQVGNEAMFSKYEFTDEESLVQFAIRIYEDQTSWNEIQLEQISILDTYFSDKNLIKQFIEKCHFTLENLDDFRENNFYQNLFLEQQLLSTKYMSKWIEEKNKK